VWQRSFQSALLQNDTILSYHEGGGGAAVKTYKGSRPKVFSLFYHHLLFLPLAPPILKRFFRYTISSCDYPLTKAILHRPSAGTIPLINLVVDLPQSAAHQTLNLKIKIHSRKAIPAFLPLQRPFSRHRLARIPISETSTARTTPTVRCWSVDNKA